MSKMNRPAQRGAGLIREESRNRRLNRAGLLNIQNGRIKREFYAKNINLYGNVRKQNGFEADADDSG